MTIPMFEVLAAGPMTTVQDVGRPGYLATGMPASGAADRFGLGIANLLVGNDPGERYLVGKSPGDAGLEILLLGLRLKALADGAVAVAGADLTPTLNGKPLPMWHAIRVRAGDEIAFNRPAAGARAYLAVAGGIDVPKFAGSRATNVRAFVGGVELVKDKETREPFDPAAGLDPFLLERLLHHGAIARTGMGLLGFLPPLIITEAEIKELVRRVRLVLDDALAWVDERGLRRMKAAE